MRKTVDTARGPYSSSEGSARRVRMRAWCVWRGTPNLKVSIVTAICRIQTRGRGTINDAPANL